MDTGLHALPRLGIGLCLALSTTLAACGDDAGNNTTGDTRDASETVDTSTPLSEFNALADAFCPAMAAANCGRVEACACTGIPGFPADCEAQYQAQCLRELERYRIPVLRGEAIPHPEGVPACVAAYEAVAASCVTLPNDLYFLICPILAPPGGFEPRVGVGRACGEAICADGLRCGSEGKCVTPRDVDAPCTGPTDCATHLVCDVDHCAAPRVTDAGKACSGDTDCGGDTACLASARKVCKAPALNDACRFDEDCPANAYCATDASGENGLCKTAPAATEACVNGVVCGTGLACKDGVCGPKPGLGAPCAEGPSGPVVCADGLACVDFTCAEPPTEGETCALGAPNCADGLGCAFEGENNVCRAKLDAGGACQNDLVCKPGTFCNFAVNQCMATYALGDRCKDGNECGANAACLPDALFDFRCTPKPALGGECFLDECQPGLICRTPYTSGVCSQVICQAFRF